MSPIRTGREAVVIKDSAAYERLLKSVERVEAVEGIQRGLESMERGEGRPAKKALEAIRKRHGIPRDA